MLQRDVVKLKRENDTFHKLLSEAKETIEENMAEYNQRLRNLHLSLEKGESHRYKDAIDSLEKQIQDLGNVRRTNEERIYKRSALIERMNEERKGAIGLADDISQKLLDKPILL